MGNYLILTYNVCNMGGAQLYTLRRAKYLLGKGYKVSVVVGFDNGHFPLKERFDGVDILYLPEIALPYLASSKALRENKVREIIYFAFLQSSSIIESHTLSTIEWGELIASTVKCKHVAYPLSEMPVDSYNWQPGRRIFKEKLNRNQMIGLSDMSLPIIFGTHNLPNNYVNVGFDENELVETSMPLIQYKKEIGQYVITTVTRLDKTYVEPLIVDTVKLAKEFPEQNFVLLIAGGSKTGNREQYLTTKYSNMNINCSNLDVEFNGYITYLGKDIFQMTDVFVGTGLAAINAISQGCVTVVVDESDDLTGGFFGTDTNNFGYAINKVTIYEKLKEAYLMKPEVLEKVKHSGRQLFKIEFDCIASFEKLDRLIEKMQKVNNNCNFTNVSICERLFFGFKSFLKQLYNKVIN